MLFSSIRLFASYIDHVVVSKCWKVLLKQRPRNSFFFPHIFPLPLFCLHLRLHLSVDFTRFDFCWQFIASAHHCDPCVWCSNRMYIYIEPMWLYVRVHRWRRHIQIHAWEHSINEITKKKTTKIKDYLTSRQLFSQHWATNHNYTIKSVKIYCVITHTRGT